MALKERGIAVTGTVRKGASGYPPRLLQLKKVNRGLISPVSLNEQHALLRVAFRDLVRLSEIILLQPWQKEH
jgi:hypothetical protein